MGTARPIPLLFHNFTYLLFMMYHYILSKEMCSTVYALLCGQKQKKFVLLL